MIVLSSIIYSIPLLVICQVKPDSKQYFANNPEVPQHMIISGWYISTCFFKISLLFLVANLISLYIEVCLPGVFFKLIEAIFLRYIFLLRSLALLRYYQSKSFSKLSIPSVHIATLSRVWDLAPFDINSVKLHPPFW